MQLVVLAGGLGTRLRGAIPAGLPKPMASIAGRPFLEHLLDRAIAQGVCKVHLLVGYAAEVIVGHLGDSYRGFPVTYTHEGIPLGTGGALRAARKQLADEFVLVNGDTFAEVSYQRLVHSLGANVISMSLANMSDVSRYGTVITDADAVVGFREKGGLGAGLVNAGVYACRKDLVDLLPDRLSFSFERDFLEAKLPQLKPRFIVASSEVIDIGTPESFALANFVFGT